MRGPYFDEFVQEHQRLQVCMKQMRRPADRQHMAHVRPLSQERLRIATRVTVRWWREILACTS